MLEELAFGAGVGTASAGVGSALSYFGNKALQEQQYQNQQKLMNKSYALGQSAQRASASNLVQGAKAAGLSPLAVLGQSFSAAQGPSGEASGASMQVPTPDIAGAVQAVANARLANSEADLKQKELSRENDADNAFVVTYRQSLERELADLKDQQKNGADVSGRIAEVEASIAKLDDPNYAGTVGILKGIQSGADYNKANFDVVNNYLNGRLDKQVLIKKFGNGTADALANIPVQNQKKMAEDIKYVQQLIAESESKEKLNDQTVLEAQAKIQQIGNDILHANLNDPNFIKSFYGEKSPEWKNWTDTQWREEAFRVGEKVIEGVATGSALAVVNQGFKAMNDAKKPQPKRPSEIREETTFSRGRRRSIRSVMYE